MVTGLAGCISVKEFLSQFWLAVKTIKILRALRTKSSVHMYLQIPLLDNLNEKEAAHFFEETDDE